MEWLFQHELHSAPAILHAISKNNSNNALLNWNSTLSHGLMTLCFCPKRTQTPTNSSAFLRYLPQASPCRFAAKVGFFSFPNSPSADVISTQKASVSIRKTSLDFQNVISFALLTRFVSMCMFLIGLLQASLAVRSASLPCESCSIQRTPKLVIAARRSLLLKSF